MTYNNTRRKFHNHTASMIGIDTHNTTIEQAEESEVTLEYVQRLEQEIAEKDKQIKLIKQKLVNDSRRSSPVIFDLME